MNRAIPSSLANENTNNDNRMIRTVSPIETSPHNNNIATSATMPVATVASGRHATRCTNHQELGGGSGKFSASSIPQGIHKRALQQHSVHYSVSNGCWIATIHRCVDGNNGLYSYTGNNNDMSYTKPTITYSFATEHEARKFCKTYTPPRNITPTPTNCMICKCKLRKKSNSSDNLAIASRSNNPISSVSSSFTSYSKSPPCWCRNCGIVICDKKSCSVRWGIHMIPKTYHSYNNSLTVRVCKFCDWVSNAFCMALLQGKLSDAVTIYEKGNVNLRSPFANINGEAMFPVHCAVMGGNLALLKWLVEKQSCPVLISKEARGGGRKTATSVRTTSGRSLIDLAMTGKPKIDILRYLVTEKNMSIQDTKDPLLASKTLEVLLRAGIDLRTQAQEQDPAHHVIPAAAAAAGPGCDDVISEIGIDANGSFCSSTNIEDACNICFENSMDCVLIPCGHQICCQECGKHFKKCPVCNVDCSVLRIFRQ